MDTLNQNRDDIVPKVSIIVPVYKVEKYLRGCIESIEAQEYDNLSLILVDDGSPDECPAICDALAKEHNNIHVIHKENGGLSSARNAGLDSEYITSSKYVLFIDSDDTMPLGVLQQMVCLAEKEGSEVVLPDRYNSINEKTGKETIRLHFPPEMYDRNPVTFVSNVVIRNARAWRATTILYRADLICTYKIRFPQGRISEDIVFNLQYMSHVKSISIIPIVTANNLKRSGSISNSYQPNFHEDIKYIDACAYEFLVRAGIDEYKSRELCDDLLARNYTMYLFSLCSKRNPLSKKEKVNKYEYILNEADSGRSIRKKHSMPWFENRKNSIAYFLITRLLRYRMDRCAFFLLSHVQ